MIIYDPETGQGAYHTEGHDLSTGLLVLMVMVFIVLPALGAIYLIASL